MNEVVMKSSWDLVLWEVGEDIVEYEVSVEVDAPGLKRSWGEAEAWHYVAVVRLPEKSLEKAIVKMHGSFNGEPNIFGDFSTIRQSPGTATTIEWN